MALTVRNPTLLDLAKRTDPDGSISVVVEILNETNEILLDMGWQEGNLPTGHRTTIRTGIPTPTWRKMYGGVQPTKSTTVQVTDNTGMLEAYAEVDSALADLNGNTAEWRLSEDRAFIEGMNVEMADTLFFGNETSEPEAFTGFAPRYNSLTAANGDNIIDAGSLAGQTDNTSIWMVVWSPNTVHGIIPKGSVAGLQVKDHGEVTLEDASDGANSGRMQAYRTHYKWMTGLSVRDWRYIVRICNIDKSLLKKDAATGGADLPDLIFQGMNLIPNMNFGRPVLYMSRDTMTFIRRQLSSATNLSTLARENVGGTMTDTFQGVPMRRCDSLAADETRVT